MKYSFQLIVILAFLAIGMNDSAAHSFSDESLNYNVSYKWGLIHKTAGTATLTLHNRGNVYDIRLTAKSKPWADRIYRVRDTLIAKIAKNGFKPQSYKRIAHEDGKFALDELTYSYNGATTTGTVKRTREKKGKRTTSSVTHSTTGAAYDLLTVFYYLRTIDFSSIPKGKVVVTTLFSGKAKERVTIKPVGLEKITMPDKRKVEAYHIRFNFTTDGAKKSSDDIDAWISCDGRGIPLMVIGALPIGQIRCVYTGK